MGNRKGDAPQGAVNREGGAKAREQTMECKAWSVAELRGLRQVRDLAPNSAARKKVNSLSVRLLEQGVVEKRYDAAVPGQVRKFDKEVAILRRLNGCKNVPRLYAVDEASKTFWEEYVGAPRKTLDPAMQAKVGKALRGLARCHQVYRVKGGKRRQEYKHLFPGNVCVTDGGDIKLIDFGSDLWQLGPGRVRHHRPASAGPRT
jgi:hypothetical protein